MVYPYTQATFNTDRTNYYKQLRDAVLHLHKTEGYTDLQYLILFRWLDITNSSLGDFDDLRIADALLTVLSHDLANITRTCEESQYISEIIIILGAMEMHLIDYDAYFEWVRIHLPSILNKQS